MIEGDPKLIIWCHMESPYDRYYISQTGKIRNSDGKILQFSMVSNYYSISIGNPNCRKTLRVHRLVAKYFVSKTDPEYNVVNHIDGCTTNNRFTNLEWTDQAGNCAKKINPVYGRRNRRVCQLDDDDNIINEWKSVNECRTEVKLS